MKKLISMILALFVMLIPVVGCSNSDNESSGPSLTLNHSMINLSLFGEADVIASYENIDEITWANSNSEVVTMEQFNNYVHLTAIGAGISNITVTSGKTTATCMVIVGESDYALTVTLNRIGDVEINAGSSTFIPATATFRGEAIEGAKLLYSVDDETIATVSDAGEITGLKAGETTLKIIAEYDTTRSAPCLVKILVKSGPSLMLNATYFNLFEYDKSVGQSYYPSTANFKPYIVDGENVDKNIEYTVENTNDDVAVIENGVVKSVGAGETMFTITCPYGEQTYVAYLYVYVKAIPKVEVVLNETDILLYADPVDAGVYSTMQSMNYVVRIDGVAVNGDISWAVDAGNSVATVTNKGVIKSISAGKAVISANFRYNGESYKATCNVTVLEDLFYGEFKNDYFTTNMIYAYLSNSYPTLKIKDVDLTTTNELDLLRVGVPNVDGNKSVIYRLFIRATDVNDSQNWVEFVYSHYNNGSTNGLGAYAMNASTWNLKGLAGVGYSYRYEKMQIMASSANFTYCGAGGNAGKAGVADGAESMKFKETIGRYYDRQMTGFSIVGDEVYYNFLSTSNGTRNSKLVFSKELQETLLVGEYANPVWKGFTEKGTTKVNLTIKAQLDGSNKISPIIIDTIGGAPISANNLSQMSIISA